MNTFLVVGKKFSGLTNKILRQGDDYILLQDVLSAKQPERRLRRRVIADFSSREALLATVDTIGNKVDAVITVYEDYVLPTAIIAEHLGLPGLPVKAAEACTDKYIMRKLFMQSKTHISPDFDVVSSKSSLEIFAATHAFPLILKPANLSKSLLVTKNHNLAELLQNYDRTVSTLERIYKKHAPHRQPKLIVEEFLEGPIHSVDAFVDSIGTPHVLENVVDYQTGYDIGYDDNFHYSRLLPSALAEAETKAVRDTAALGCKALGMKSSPAHIEIIRTSQGPKIVEIGARNGGYRERMHRLANGIDIPGNALNLALDEPLELTATRNDPCAVLELFPKRPGIFTGIANEGALKALPSLSYFAIKQPLNEFVGKSSDGYKMCAIIILHNKDSSAFLKDLSFVNSSVIALTKSA